MHFTRTEDQTMLADSLRGYFGRSEKSGAEQRWRELAELGITGVTIDEAHGGAGCGGRELEVIAAELGRARCISPFIPTVAIFATMIAEGGSDALKEKILPQITDGTLTGALAWQERNSRYSLERIETRAVARDGVWTLDGHKSQVLYGDRADWLLVTAKLDSEADAVGVFLVEATAAGVERAPLKLVDGQPAADIRFNGIKLQQDARLSGGSELVRLGLDWTAAALCGETVAGMEELLRMTVDYIGIRVQFGRPIGRNQALQHRAADMLMQLERARSMSVLAAEALSYRDEAERQRAVAQACYMVATASRFVSEQAIQLHGGIGMTAEHEVSHYVQRLFLNRMIIGDGEEQLNRLHSMRAIAA